MLNDNFNFSNVDSNEHAIPLSQKRMTEDAENCYTLLKMLNMIYIQTVKYVYNFV